MFDFALPLNWRAELKKQIRQIDMGPAELFQTYSTRAPQFVVYGLPEALQHRVAKRQLLDATPFVYGAFEQAVNAPALALGQSTLQPNPGRQVPSTNVQSAREDFIWQIHSYLDSQGRCHFCKKACGNIPGSCPGPVKKRYVDAPENFITRPRPANYIAPKARGPAQPAPGKPVNPPAGRPPTQAATVAAVQEYDTANAAAMSLVDKAIAEDALDGPADNIYPPHLHVSSVEAYEDLDAYRLSIEAVKYVPPPPALLSSPPPLPSRPRTSVGPQVSSPPSSVASRLANPASVPPTPPYHQLLECPT
ncbi:hypothetical protein PTTG_07986 [Puccinia triticina 1-1 BBBD Race 1]|uniref:Uncharacterized protein n=1 Tax=Puccinia triticina (isolate 1-1 / race 1 (BBBD)) TaxID=630390 RepID=A0A180G6T3_PUCT1|nr:hypothetical protein PTTG_07986 [Puccinia triticina 1-1 BBBD Race 1]